ncbi:MAG: FGGY family carbohydrate kinase [Gammaproteobacteria bacterium]|nr:FGGY family carbohydrate kinase [Gammaproteobacteria bacterium]
MKTKKDNWYLALDQGGHATRGIVYDSQGKEIFSAYSEIDTYTPDNLRVEHDPVQYINSFSHILTRITQQTGEDAKRIVAAGLATQRSSMVCWDRETGEALSPILSWQDRRTLPDLGKYQTHQDLISKNTGLVLNAHYGASKMRWCLENLESVKRYCEGGRLAIGPVASFVLYKLINDHPFVCDPANAGRTLLYNYHTGDWDQTLLALFQIDRQHLPECRYTRDRFGTIQLGDRRIPLTICTGDQSAAIFAMGIPPSQTLFVNAGTGAFVQQVIAQQIDSEADGLLRSIVYTEPNSRLYVKEGTVNGAGRALQWYAQEHQVENYEDSLSLWTEQYQNPPVFLNMVSGIGSPFWISEGQSRFDRSCDSQEAMVAILESIVFMLQSNMALFSGYKNIQIGGGLGRNPGFCQKLADLSGIPVIRQSLSETTCAGLFFLLAEKTTSNDLHQKAFYPTCNPGLLDRFQQWRKLLDDHIR